MLSSLRAAGAIAAVGSEQGDFHMTYLEGTTSTDLKHVLRLQTTSYLISPLAEYIL